MGRWSSVFLLKEVYTIDFHGIRYPVQMAGMGVVLTLPSLHKNNGGFGLKSSIG